jgi:hypothetical protein
MLIKPKGIHHIHDIKGDSNRLVVMHGKRVDQITGQSLETH